LKFFRAIFEPLAAGFPRQPKIPEARKISRKHFGFARTETGLGRGDHSVQSAGFGIRVNLLET